MSTSTVSMLLPVGTTSRFSIFVGLTTAPFCHSRSRLLRVVRKIVGVCRFHISAQVELENVVFEIYWNELFSSLSGQQFLETTSHLLTHFAVNGNHVTTVMSQIEIFSSFARDLCSTAQPSVQRSKQTVFIVTLDIAKVHHQICIRHWLFGTTLHLQPFFGPKINGNVSTAAPVSRLILTHSNRLGLLMARRSKLPSER